VAHKIPRKGRGLFLLSSQPTFIGRVAEWLGTALQKLLLRFESARDLDQQMPRSPGHLAFRQGSTAKLAWGRGTLPKCTPRSQTGALLIERPPQYWMPGHPHATSTNGSLAQQGIFFVHHHTLAYRSSRPGVSTGAFHQTMRIVYSLIFALSLFCPEAYAQSDLAIGQWRDHYPYLSARSVIEGGGVAYCASRNAIFKVDPATNELEKFSKVNALSDVDITALGWSTELSALLVGYANGNLDVIRGGVTTNMTDIKRSSLIGDKRLYSIMCDGGLAYLGCGFGIVVVDLTRNEVKDTWIIGLNGEQRQVNGVVLHGDSIYAATDKGVFAAKRTEPNLAAFTNWYRRTDLPNFDKNFNGIVSFAGKLMVNYASVTDNSDVVYYYDGSWQTLGPALGRRNTAIHVSADGQRLVVPHRFDVRMFDQGLQEVLYAGTIAGLDIEVTGAYPRSSGGAWVATTKNGLGLVQAGSSGSFVSPNGPRSTNAYRIDASDGLLVAATGAVAGNWSNTYSHDGIHLFQENTWRTIREEDDPLLEGANTFGGGAVDPMAVVVDPSEAGHFYLGTWDDGVIEWRNGAAIAIWNATNSSLGTTGNPADGIVYVAGLDLDKDENLWVSNANTNALLSVRKKNGEWRSFSPGNLLGGSNLVSDVMAAHENNLKWLVRPRGNALLAFTDGGTIDDSGDDQFKLINTSENQGKLPSLDVYSVAEDKDGEVWVGTGKGIAVFYNSDAIFSGTGENFDCQQILIEQDGNVQILLETESVSAIAVDGANRKWLGTQSSGVFLVSPDGTQQVVHFTAENSPLPSNNITSIAIDGSTGEVFFATEQGMISYRGDATDGSRTEDCATVFPNPVRETYSGPVAITGLVADSDVRITDIAGNMVYKTTSLGGQAIWPATDLTGQRVSTGIYLVMASDPTGATTCNTKVLVVR
jgi:Two component regulator propeller